MSSFLRRAPRLSVMFLLFVSAILLAGSGFLVLPAGAPAASAGAAVRATPEDAVGDSLPAAPAGMGIPAIDGSQDSRLPEIPDPLAQTQDTSLAYVGGLDDFGYDIRVPVASSWIDAVGHTRLAGCTEVRIGFPFKFYENTYRTLYVSNQYYLTFTPDGCSLLAPAALPNPALPNNVISPFSSATIAAVGYSGGDVWTARGGTAPYRYLVIEWSHLTAPCWTYGCTRPGSGWPPPVSFEIILRESGNIRVEGQCDGPTIENSTGLDGLRYGGCPVVFRRPAGEPGLEILPFAQDGFVTPGEPAAATFGIPIRNTGATGTDVYEVQAESLWPVSLYQSDGATPLSDTDNDGQADTGPVAQGSDRTIFAKVTAPVTSTAGDVSTTTLTVRSSLATTRSKSTTLHTTAVDLASFAQVLRDGGMGQIRLDLIRPQGRVEAICGEQADGVSDIGVVETAGGNFVCAWRRGSSIMYAMVDRSGRTVAGGALAYAGLNPTISVSSPVLAATPDGHVGIAWVYFDPDQMSPATNLRRTRVELRILNDMGHWISGASAESLFVDPFPLNIVATADNRFVLPWHAYPFASRPFYGIISSTGQTVTTTVSAPGDAIFAALSPLAGNRVLLLTRGPGDIYAAVMDSDGNTVRAPADISNGTTGANSSPDAVQVPSGETVVAWIGDGRVRLAVLDASYILAVGPLTLHDPGDGSDDALSVTADGAGHAVITWRQAGVNLYYAVVDAGGNVLTPPVIFRRAGTATSPSIITSANYGATTRSSALPEPPTPTAIATHTKTPTATATRTETATATPTATKTPYVKLANAGGPKVTDSLLQVWLADRLFTDGGWGYAGPTTGTLTTTASIFGTLDGTLYQTARTAMTAYKFSVPNGTYSVTLKFAEIQYNKPLKRVFDVKIETLAVLTNFDVFAEAGGKFTAVDRPHTTTVSDGVLNVVFVAHSGAPLISAIEVRQQ
jgi:hypothetical protein